ncbi:MAG: DUF4920 domain-containing protein [Myxococcales bacterium]|nr:DUF4920 domain-containing protein [Myxococcales bacterium]
MILTLLVLALACTPQPAPVAPVAGAAAGATPAAAPDVAPAAAAAPAWHVNLGEPFAAAEIVPVDTIMKDPAAWNGKDVVVEGLVKEVCQKKGCWHTVATADPAVALMIKDKEYKIFLPKDSAGKKVHIHGIFAVADMPQDEARHYAEDAGRDPSTIVGVQKSFEIDVAGVKFVEG